MNKSIVGRTVAINTYNRRHVVGQGRGQIGFFDALEKHRHRFAQVGPVGVNGNAVHLDNLAAGRQPQTFAGEGNLEQSQNDERRA